MLSWQGLLQQLELSWNAARWRVCMQVVNLRWGHSLALSIQQGSGRQVGCSLLRHGFGAATLALDWPAEHKRHPLARGQAAQSARSTFRNTCHGCVPS